MALDKNLFTLNLEQSKIEPSALDLVDPSGMVHYRKRMIPNEAGTYMFALSDPLSESIFATAAAPSAISKEKTIELYNPSATVSLTYKGKLTFKWRFTWEEHQFEWRREECYMIRKPDPPVLVAVTKEPSGKIKTSTVQILDYNLNRFDIEDRKGLEVVMLTALLTFNDYSDQARTPQRRQSSENGSSAIAPTPPGPPPPPPKPEGWKEDQIAILQVKEQSDLNEVVVDEFGGIDEYVRHCVSLLNDETLLFITLRSLTPASVSKVVQIAEATKRTHYKNRGYNDDEELYQYVDMSYEEPIDKKGKGKARVINLDDSPPPSAAKGNAYKPPTALKIHLSKISMPELEPKRKETAKKHSEKKTQNSPPPGIGHHRHSSSESATNKLSKRKSAAISTDIVASTGISQPPSSGLRAKLSSLALSSSSRPKSPILPLSPQPSYPPIQHGRIAPRDQSQRASQYHTSPHPVYPLQGSAQSPGPLNAVPSFYGGRFGIPFGASSGKR